MCKLLYFNVTMLHFFFAGVNNFRKDIEMMLGKQHPAFWIYWYATWCFITPAAIGVSHLQYN